MTDSNALIHQKRPRSKKKDKKNEALQAALNGTPIYSPAQKEFDFNCETIRGMEVVEMDY